MRILFIHNYYQHPGGEDVVFEQEKTLLALTEHVFSLTFNNKKGWRGAWQTFWSPWNIWAAQRLKRAIRQYKPDVIHIHNLHYAVGPIAVRVAKRMGIPVVMTVHNYRLLCPSSTLFHNGKLFTDSLYTEFPWKAVCIGAHSHSSVKTFWLSFTTWLHKKLGTWHMVDRYITLTDFAKQVFADSSLHLPPEKLVIKPNFVANGFQVSEARGHHFLFVGRLTQEKGVEVLLEAFVGTDYHLRIVGDGPLRAMVTDADQRHPNITYLDTLGRAAIDQQLATCTALVFPSIWYEGMPMTLIEAFAAGTPVIASNLGAMESMVHEGQNGWRFTAGNASDLREKIGLWLTTTATYRQQLGLEARREYEQRYTAEQNRLLLLNIYHSTTGAT
ncbi:glycosyltransferase family 4 protein [Parapedobacter pyrenivorans]|uniref:glycosyltransferase family 4 protein n=1 Tax=Parapedobacter pyrenivorans TaxID=1305674 RepID=UPI0033402C29